MSCPAQISDGVETIHCAYSQGHDDDHGRGYLRWDDAGQWHARRDITPDGRSVPTSPETRAAWETETPARAHAFESKAYGHHWGMSVAIRILAPVVFFGKQYLWIRLPDGRIALDRAHWPAP